MLACDLKKILVDGGLQKYSRLYADLAHQTKRMIDAIDAFTKSTAKIEIFLFSPCRAEARL